MAASPEEKYEYYDPHIDPSLQWAGKKEGTSFTVPTSSIHIHESIKPHKTIRSVQTRGDDYSDPPPGRSQDEVRWAILDHPPADLKELINSTFDTNSPLTLEFEEHERGKHVYLCGRWEIQREGEKGPDGAIEEAIIP
jgi:hypothetical protein